MRRVALVCLVAALASGVVLLAGAFIALPRAVWMTALALLAATAAVILILSFATARREGEPFWRSVRRAATSAVRWLLDLTP